MPVVSLLPKIRAIQYNGSNAQEILDDLLAEWSVLNVVTVTIQIANEDIVIFDISNGSTLTAERDAYIAVQGNGLIFENFTQELVDTRYVPA